MSDEGCVTGNPSQVTPLRLQAYCAGGKEPIEACATMSHMEIGVRNLRNRTAEVIAAVESGERVTLTVRGKAVADIVPHGERTRWLSGEVVHRELATRAADPGLADDLAELAGQTLDDL